MECRNYEMNGKKCFKVIGSNHPGFREDSNKRNAQ